MTANVTVPQQVSVTCPGCHSGQQVPRTATRIICQGCGKPIVFRKCDTTGKTFPVLAEWTTWTHPGCATRHVVSNHHPPASSRAARSRMVSSPPARKLTRSQKSAMYLGIAMIGFLGVLIFLFLLVVNPGAQYSSDLRSSSVAAEGVPGQTVDLSLTGTSIEGQWASQNGLSLALSDGKTLQVTGPVPDTWNSTISCSDYCSTQGFSVPARFSVPATARPGQTLTGSLTGDVYSPQPSGPSNFSNTSNSVNMTVTVQVITSSAQRKIPGIALLISFGIGVLFLYAALRQRRAQRVVR